MIDRPKEPPKLDIDEDDFGDAFPNERPTTPAGEPTPDDRPTVSPPFDLEEYAKSSDSKVRASRGPLPEGDATKPPPVPDFDLEDELPRVERARGPQITLTDEGELEDARLRSVLMSEPPPGGRRPPARPAPPSRGSGSTDEPPPPTRAYPADYEKDPFAQLGSEASSPPAGVADEAELPLTDMRNRFALGDYTGALSLAQQILGEDPGNVEAIRCAEESEAKLVQMYTARIGPLDRVPMVVVAREQLRWLSIDHRAGFLLSHIDGISNLEMILDVSGMPLLDALKILAELAQQRVIRFR
ncbi:MAG TPA: hypothetical protein VGI39_25320 [Polyangiaceae bacterium]